MGANTYLVSFAAQKTEGSFGPVGFRGVASGLQSTTVNICGTGIESAKALCVWVCPQPFCMPHSAAFQESQIYFTLS